MLYIRFILFPNIGRFRVLKFLLRPGSSFLLSLVLQCILPLRLPRSLLDLASLFGMLPLFFRIILDTLLPKQKRKWTKIKVLFWRKNKKNGPCYLGVLLQGRPPLFLSYLLLCLLGFIALHKRFLLRYLRRISPTFRIFMKQKRYNFSLKP